MNDPGNYTKRRCPQCQRETAVVITSASPGDGRRKYRCDECGTGWTSGKRPTEGYRRQRRPWERGDTDRPKEDR